MIQSRLECLLMSNDAFSVVSIRLIVIALAVHEAPAADEQREMEDRSKLHVKIFFIKSLKNLFFHCLECLTSFCLPFVLSKSCKNCYLIFNYTIEVQTLTLTH